MRGSVRDRIVHPSLQAERDRINFDSDELSNIIWNPENLKARRKHNKLVSVSADYKNTPHWYGWSREEKMGDAMRKFGLYNKRLTDLNQKINTMEMNELTHQTLGQFPTDMHFWMCIPMIRNLASEEQY